MLISPRKSILSFIRIFILIFAPTLVAIGAVLLISYRQTLDRTEQVLKVSQLEHVNSLSTLIRNNMESVIADLLVISSHTELETYLIEKGQFSEESLAEEFLSTVQVKQIYDQLRLLDNNGMEVIRVDLEKDGPLIVPKNELQDKSNRYYFEETQGLPYNTLYVSQFDLNIENGQLERPEKPMIRFSKPLFDENKNERGIVVINYLGESLLSLFDEGTTEDSQISFLNSDGYWFKSPFPYEEWGFMYTDKQNVTFGNKYIKAWTQIENAISGQFYTDKGLFTFTTVYPLQAYQRSTSGYNIVTSEDSYEWKIVSYIPTTQISDQLRDNLQSPFYISTFLLIILTMIIFFLSRSIWRRQQADEKVRNLYDLLKLLNKTIRHDILNNLTSIKYSLELYHDNKKKTYLSEIEAATQQGITFIHEMKQLELDGDKTQFEEVEVNSLIKKIAKSYKTLSTSITGKAFIKADKAIKSVIENIIRNSVQHGNASKVEVSIYRNGDYIEVKIADNGTGVPDKVLSQLFDEGFKHGESGNTGMGLYIVKQVMRRYGGKVYAEKNTPTGLVIILMFPAQLSDNEKEY